MTVTEHTTAELAACPAFVQAAEKLMPDISQSLQMDFVRQKTLSELSKMMPAGAVSFFKEILRGLNR